MFFLREIKESTDFGVYLQRTSSILRRVTSSSFALVKREGREREKKMFISKLNDCGNLISLVPSSQQYGKTYKNESKVSIKDERPFPPS